MKELLVAPNLTNSVSPWRRLPLVESEHAGLSYRGLGMFLTYVPSKYGGVLEVASSRPGAKVLIRYPAPDSTPLADRAGTPIPAAQTFTYHVKPGEYGWFYVLITGDITSPYKVSATFREIGLAREAKDENQDPLVPWNFWYFPNARSRKEKTAWGSSTLQPCQKYESAFGRTGVLDWEKANHNDPHGIAGAWFGHCHNSAPAAIIFKTPPAAGLTKNGISILCEELKFYATEFFGSYGAYEDDWWGLPDTGFREGFYQEHKPADDPKRFGKQIGDFHNFLAKHLLEGMKPLMMDLRAGDGGENAEVWNQAIYKYVAHFWETTPHEDWQDIQVKTELMANDDILKGDLSSTGSPAKIVANGPRAGGIPKDVAPDGARRDELLRYRLHFRRNGTIWTKSSRNEWYSTTPASGAPQLHAPRFVFIPKTPNASVKSDADGNPEIKRADVLQLLELRDRYS